MISNPGTLGKSIEIVSTILSEAGIENSRREAHLLLQYVTGKSVTDLRGFPKATLYADVWNKVLLLTKRRAQHEPMAYLIKNKEFWSLPFEVTEDTLIPRPDSETLIETILDFTPNANARLNILDLGTGCGCLLGALLTEFKYAVGVGVDASKSTSSIARRNMQRLGFIDRAEIRTGNWGDGIKTSFDIIVCNPPYIPSGEIEMLDIGVRKFEPHMALDGGRDGLESYRIIAREIHRLLTKSGLAAVELGLGQAPEVAHIFEKNGLKIKKITQDLAFQNRCLLATVRN